MDALALWTLSYALVMLSMVAVGYHTAIAVAGQKAH